MIYYTTYKEGRLRTTKEILSFIYKLIIVIALSSILFSSCTKSLSDENQILESGNYFSGGTYGDFPLNKHYDNDVYSSTGAQRDYSKGEQYNPLLTTQIPYYEDPDSFNRGIARTKYYHPRAILKYKMAANPSKKEKYEKELQKLEQEYLQNSLGFLQGFYTDLYQKDQKDFTQQYKPHCSYNIQRAMKNIYAVRHAGGKGYAWFIFGDNAKHQPSDFTFSRVGENWFKVKMDTSYVLLQLEGVKKKEFKIITLKNSRLNFTLQ